MKALPATIIYAAQAHRQTSLYPPLGVGYLSATLKREGIPVRAVDLAIEEGDGWLAAAVPAGGETAVCVSFTTPYRDFTARLLEKIKRRAPRSTVIVGGPHPTILPEDALSLPGVDIAVRGEGELVLGPLLRSLAAGKGWEEVPGISYRGNGRVVHVGDTPRPEDLDALPFPDFDAFPIERYFRLKGFRELPVITARGCPMRCTFCQPTVNRIFGPRVRFRSPGSVVDEMEFLFRRYRLDLVFFSDDTFTADQGRVVAICEEMLRRRLNIFWRCASTVGLKRETLRAMRRSGCLVVSFGVESGSPLILRNVEKNITPEKTRETFRSCQELGLLTWAFLMVGNPGETRETVVATADLVREIKPFGSSVSVTLPLPGTRMHESALSAGMLFHRSDLEFDYLFSTSYKNMLHLEKLSPSEVLELKSWLERESAGSASRLRDILRLTLDRGTLKRLLIRIRRDPRFVRRVLVMLVRMLRVKSLRILNPRITSHHY